MQHENTRETKAVIYLRVASAHLADAEAVSRQREGCLRIAAEHELMVVREYVDRDCPAVLARQTGLRQLLDDLARRNDAAFVIVWDYARLGRSMEQLDEVIRCIHACGAEVTTIRGVEAADRYVRERQAGQQSREWEV